MNLRLARRLRWLGRGHGRPLGILLTLALTLLLLSQAGKSANDAALEQPRKTFVGKLLRSAADVPRQLRNFLFDFYQTAFPRQRRNDSVVIAAIDEASVVGDATHPAIGQWPWPRDVLAGLISQIEAQQPAAIVIDAFFSELDRLSPRSAVRKLVDTGLLHMREEVERLPDTDEMFATALRDAPVVIGVSGVSGATREMPANYASILLAEDATLAGVRSYDAVLPSIPLIDEAARGHGVMNGETLPADRGIVRHIPTLVSVGGRLLPGLSVEALRVALDAGFVRVRNEGARVTEVQIAGRKGRVRIPTEADGEWWLHYSRPEDRDRTLVSAADIRSGKVADGTFTNRIVLFGFTALGLQDTALTPLGRVPGIYVHAEALDNVLDGRLLSRPRWAHWLEAALLALLSAIAVIAVPWLRPATAAGTFTGSALVALGGSAFAFVQRGWLLDGANPAIGAAIVFIFMLALTLRGAELQRQRLRTALVASREAQARLEGELDAARRIQMGMLPTAAEALDGEQRVEIGALMHPARSVGGDLYDFFMLDDSRLFFMVGDVSGKGLPASLFMALAKALIKGAALHVGTDPGRALSEAGIAIAHENPELLFVTVLAGALDLSTGELAWCSAGHEAPYLRRQHADAPQRLEGKGGPPLCVIDGFRYASERAQLAPGEALCIVTDGVTEAENDAGEFYGPARVAARLAQLPAETSAGLVVDALQRDVTTFAGGKEQSDDLTILVIRRAR